MRNHWLVFFFVTLFVPMYSCTVLTARNVTVIESKILDSFLFEAADLTVDTTQQSGRIDILALLIQKNLIIYEHFAELAKFKSGNLTNAAAANFAFLLGFYGIIEYLEVNGIPGLQVVGWNAKDGISDLPLSEYYNSTAGNIDWEITVQSQLTQFPDGGIATIYEVTFATSDGVFNYTVTYAGRQLNIGKVVIDQNTFKIGFNINYYNYNGASKNENSRIALVLVVASTKAAAKQVNNNNGSPSSISAIKINSGGYSGFVNFESQADTWDISGVKRSADITFGYVDQYGTGVGFADWTAAALVLSYNATRPQTISYDPEIGASIPSQYSASPFQTAPNVVFTLFVLMTLLF